MEDFAVVGRGVEIRFRMGITKDAREGYEIAVSGEASHEDVARTVELAFIARADVLQRLEDDRANKKG